MRWFRFYEEALNDPKVQTLPSTLFRSWVNILCLASQGDGEIMSVDDVAFALRISKAVAHDIVAQLVDYKLLDQVDGGHFAPHNWGGRQFKSDVSTERVRQFRKRQRNVPSNNNGTPSATPPESETDSEKKERKKEKKERAVDLAQNSVPREASKVPPAAAARAAAALEFSKEDSPEDQFWELATTLSHHGIARSRSAQLLKLCDGDFKAALALLRQVTQANHPPSYLGAIIAKLKTEQAPVTIAIGGDLTEPEFVREYRAEGYTVEHRSNNTWKIGREIFDANGNLVGF